MLHGVCANLMQAALVFKRRWTMLVELVLTATLFIKMDLALILIQYSHIAHMLQIAITRGMPKINKLVISLAQPNFLQPIQVNLAAPFLQLQALQGPLQPHPAQHPLLQGHPQHQVLLQGHPQLQVHPLPHLQLQGPSTAPQLAAAAAAALLSTQTHPLVVLLASAWVLLAMLVSMEVMLPLISIHTQKLFVFLLYWPLLYILIRKFKKTGWNSVLITHGYWCMCYGVCIVSLFWDFVLICCLLAVNLGC